MFSSLPVHSMSSSCFLSFLLIVLGLSAAYIYIYIFALSSELDGLTIFYYYLLLLLFFALLKKIKQQESIVYNICLRIYCLMLKVKD